MPATTMSASKPSMRPSLARRTQSTGVPSVAKPLVPSSKGTCCTHSGRRVVIMRAKAERLPSGAMTASSMPGTCDQRPAHGLQALGLDAVVVGEQDLHLSHPILSRSLDIDRRRM